jgi:hypothetical protein
MLYVITGSVFCFVSQRKDPRQSFWPELPGKEIEILISIHVGIHYSIGYRKNDRSPDPAG